MITLDADQGLLSVENRLRKAQLKKIIDAINDITDLNGVITLSFITDGEIQRLNRMYRKKDSVTDVLSFSYAHQKPKEGELLGEVVISFEQAKRQAEDIELELLDLIIHGILHVLGYDHETPADAAIMLPLQDKILSYVLNSTIL